MRALVAAALILACRGDRGEPHAGSGSAAVASVVPALPRSTNGADELRMISERVERNADRPGIAIAALLDRATYLGHLDDYRDAVARSATWIAQAPDDIDAWRTRVRALSAVHEFAAARAALATVQKLATTPYDWTELASNLDEATGPREHVLAEHAAAAPNAINLTRYAASLALAGRIDEAIALIPRAAHAIRDNSALLFAWLLFQWGRLYEQNGDLAAARQFYAQACTRLPGYLEATAHLAQTSIATGDTAGAKRVVAAALADNRQPTLLELAAQLGIAPVADARAEWERYVAALPLAFADHAARFYLGVGADPKRALALAAQNLANRDVPEARALVVEAALAAGDSAAACAAVDALRAAPLRAHRFMAWRALVACGRSADADRLAKELGISP
jgi:thioredoxin-like negative regulator of GroEL